MSKKWVKVEKQLPPPNVKVELKRVVFNSYADGIETEWHTTGWIRESGLYSVKQTEDKEITFKNSKPTHWREIAK